VVVGTDAVRFVTAASWRLVWSVCEELPDKCLPAAPLADMRVLSVVAAAASTSKATHTIARRRHDCVSERAHIRVGDGGSLRNAYFWSRVFTGNTVARPPNIRVAGLNVSNIFSRPVFFINITARLCYSTCTSSVSRVLHVSFLSSSAAATAILDCRKFHTSCQPISTITAPMHSRKTVWPADDAIEWSVSRRFKGSAACTTQYALVFALNSIASETVVVFARCAYDASSIMSFFVFVVTTHEIRSHIRPKPPTPTARRRPLLNMHIFRLRRLARVVLPN
jgi:hypothetical protein